MIIGKDITIIMPIYPVNACCHLSYSRYEIHGTILSCGPALVILTLPLLLRFAFILWSFKRLWLVWKGQQGASKIWLSFISRRILLWIFWLKYTHSKWTKYVLHKTKYEKCLWWSEFMHTRAPRNVILLQTSTSRC